MVSNLGDHLILFWLVQATITYYSYVYSLSAFTFGFGVLAVFAAFLGYLYWDSTYWKRHGIPGPEPNLFLGTTLQLRNGYHRVDIQNKKRFGDTYGSYCFGYRELVTSDTKLLRQIFDSDFNSFSTRLKTNVVQVVEKQTIMQLGLVNLEGSHWRRVRNVVEKCLTNSIIESYANVYYECAEKMADAMEQFALQDGLVPLKELCGRMTLDVIAQMAFDTKLNLYDTCGECDILYHTKELFKRFGYNSPKNWFVVSFAHAASFIQQTTGIEFFRNEHHDFFEKRLTETYRKRKKLNDEGEVSGDLLQHLMHYVKEKEDIDDKTRAAITETELIAQVFILLLVGYDTSSTLLHFIFYVLARMPDLQDKLRDELYEMSTPYEFISIRQLKDMHLLNRILKEALHMYPPAGRTTRMCTAPTRVGDIDFVPGMLVSVPIYAMHHDPEVYPDPYTFNPDRFLPANTTPKMDNVYSFSPFGHGKRRCTGKILAETEIKMAVACVIRDFKLTPDPNGPNLPLPLDTRGLTRPTETLKVQVERLFQF